MSSLEIAENIRRVKELEEELKNTKEALHKAKNTIQQLKNQMFICGTLVVDMD